jgi:hypothetical protein
MGSGDIRRSTKRTRNHLTIHQREYKSCESKIPYAGIFWLDVLSGLNAFLTFKARFTFYLWVASLT